LKVVAAEVDLPSGPTGRRDIKEIKDESQLDEETKEAMRAEKERQEAIKRKKEAMAVRDHGCVFSLLKNTL